MRGGNIYVQAAGEELINEIPKTVLAAIAISALTFGGDELQLAAQRLAREWRVLYESGIVPQRPTRAARAAEVPETK